MKRTVLGHFGELVKLDVPRGPDGKVRVGVWDRGMTPGQKNKDGVETEFSSRTFGEMVDNWLKRGEVLALCYNHQSAYVQQNGQPAPSLAFYSAVAVVMGGRVERFEKLHLAGDLEPPDVALLTEQVSQLATDDDPNPSPDGMWFYRCEVTPKGEELLPNFKYLSPMFVTEGKDEQGNDVGYVLFDLAATNTAFQSGCTITFNHGAGSGAIAPTGTGGKKMGKLAKLCKFAKLDEGADDAAVKQALLQKMEDDAKSAMEEDDAKLDYAALAKQYEDAASSYEDAVYEEDGDDEDEPPHVVMRRLARKFRRLAKTEEATDGDDAQQMAADPSSPSVPGEHGQDPGSVSEKEKAGFSKMEEEGEEEEAKKSFAAVARRLGVNFSRGMSSEQMLDAISAHAVPASEIPKLVGEQVKRELEAARTAQTRAECAVKAKALVEAMEGFPASKKKDFLKLASDPATYEMAVALAKPFLGGKEIESVLFTRLTAAGAPLGALPESARASAAPSRDRKVYHTGIATFVEEGGEFARVALEWSEAKSGPVKDEIDAQLAEHERTQPGLRLYAANNLLKKKRPDLWAAAEENNY